MKETTYVNNVIEGIVRRYHSNGNLKEESEYKNGILLNKTTFDLEGNKKKYQEFNSQGGIIAEDNYQE